MNNAEFFTRKTLTFAMSASFCNRCSVSAFSVGDVFARMAQ